MKPSIKIDLALILVLLVAMVGVSIHYRSQQSTQESLFSPERITQQRLEALQLAIPYNGTRFPEAVRRMTRALDEYDVAGVPTTIPFCRFVMAHEAFRRGDLSTHFVADHFDPAALTPDAPALDRAAAVAAVLYRAAEAPTAAEVRDAPAPPPSRWTLRRRAG